MRVSTMPLPPEWSLLWMSIGPFHHLPTLTLSLLPFPPPFHLPIVESETSHRMLELTQRRQRLLHRYYGQATRQFVVLYVNRTLPPPPPPSPPPTPSPTVRRLFRARKPDTTTQSPPRALLASD
ncbi:unnamed protein product [Protopolystoma xenopodis]|uniref:Uncharacterized protein n=1 Tax=Protopolystoma xenopodis TaxID=117903 RepID=A0A448XPK7_9PLAT|nr:unnamed protein product [Protopolystoma xenopodis]